MTGFYVCSADDCPREGRPLADYESVYREITGLERLRSGGGANAIVNRQETGRVFCKACAERMRAPDQEQLFA